MLKDCRSD